MILGIAGPIAAQQSAPNVAQHFPYVENQDAAHHAYGQTTVPGKTFNVGEVNLS
jgi:hypothetical protein